MEDLYGGASPIVVFGKVPKFVIKCWKSFSESKSKFRPKSVSISVSSIKVNIIYLALISATENKPIISVIYIYENAIRMVCGLHY